MRLHYHRFRETMTHFCAVEVPRWYGMQATKQKCLEEAAERIHVADFRSSVVTSFVRNQLVDDVYLPRIGDNLAKQIGTSDADRHSDRMGLLMLVSPPGYGKTTLMEYVANRLGLAFVKVNGPALGHSVTSLDPAAAPNAASREEIRKINLAIEMQDNTMLYIDDIQHCCSEFLQKFISLCDGSRRIENVWNGKARTVDLRGRKFAVVMAGNPYTESGERFQVPDMLANRADIYNLGAIIGDSIQTFEQSYLENCLAGNPTLRPLTQLTQRDQRKVIEAAVNDGGEPIELEGNISEGTMTEIRSVLRKLHRVRDVVLQVNREYIRSAAQSEIYRTEPPFKLQGSYRNMNRIAEKVAAIMNDDEIERLIFSCYEQDAQTLSQEREANILKLKEITNSLTPSDRERWNAIKKTFILKNQPSGINAAEASDRLLSSLISLREGLDSIQLAIQEAVQRSVQ